MLIVSESIDQYEVVVVKFAAFQQLRDPWECQVIHIENCSYITLS